MADASADQKVAIDFARGLVGELAPGELPLFGAMSRAWFASPDRVRITTGRDDKLGFGVAEAGALLTPVLLAACSQVLTYFGQELCRGLAHEAASLVRERLRKLVLGEQAELTLSDQQVDRARQIALEEARRCRVPEGKAERIADALSSRLRSHA